MVKFKKFIPVIVIVLLFLFVFSLRSRFGTVGETSPAVNGKYKVEINFSYNNPTTFNGNWNGLILYLEKVGNVTEPTTTEIFGPTNKNIFYNLYYNNSTKVGSSTTQSAYTTWIKDNENTGTNIIPSTRREDIIKNIKTFKENMRNKITGTTTEDTNVNYLYDFISNYYPGDTKLYTEKINSNIQVVSTALPDNPTRVQLSTNDIELYLEETKYKFSVGIINSNLIIHTKDYEYFPFTCSKLESVELNIENIVSNPSESPTGLSAYVTFL